MARARRLKQVKRKIVDRDGILHEVWVPVLPGVGEAGCPTPDYSRKGWKRIRHQRDSWEIKQD